MVTVWQEVQSFGINFEGAGAGWGYRGEGVYTTDKPHITFDPMDDDAIAEKDTISALLGVDRQCTNDFYMNLQIVQDVILDYEDEMEPHAYEVSATFRLWQDFFRETLRLQLTGRYFFTDPDYYCKADVEYELGEALEFVRMNCFGETF